MYEDEETWRDELRWWFKNRVARVRRWYLRTFRRKRWEAERAPVSLRSFDELLKKAYPPSQVTDLTSPVGLSSKLARDADATPPGHRFKP